MDPRTKTNLRRLAVLAAILAAVACYFWLEPVKTTVDRILQMFATGDFTVVRQFVASYGPYAMAVSAMLMIFQSLIAPLPAFLITFANANLFGWWQGAILSWVSSMVGAALCFALARVLGRDVVERLTSRDGLQQIDVFFEKYGRQSVLIARLLPFMSFDIVSYAAGLTSMKLGPFLLATGLGQLPATVVYSYVGGMLTGGAKLMVTALMVLFALTVLIALLRQIYVARNAKKA